MQIQGIMSGQVSLDCCNTIPSFWLPEESQTPIFFPSFWSQHILSGLKIFIILYNEMVQAIFLMPLPPCLFALLTAVSFTKVFLFSFIYLPTCAQSKSQFGFWNAVKIWLGKIWIFWLKHAGPAAQNWAETQQKQFAKWKNNREKTHTCIQTDWSFKN